MPHYLPITLDEVRRLGWDEVDVVLVSGDAYVDHPSFGTAVIGRTLEAAGYRVAIIPQPNWRDDLRDFRKFGRPRLFFGVTSGCMDSMVNHYTAARRLRHDDAYTPGGEAGFRPDRATYVYTRILKQLYPDVPVVIGGIEASMRRLAHYDYWDDKLFPSILVDTPADLLIYGMGERTIVHIAQEMENATTWHNTIAQGDGTPIGVTEPWVQKSPKESRPEGAPQYSPQCVAPLQGADGGGAPLPRVQSPLQGSITLGYGLSPRWGSSLPQVAYITDTPPSGEDVILLHPYEDCLRSKRLQAENFQIIERESNKMESATLIQKHGDRYVVVNPPDTPFTEEELDRSFDLPYLRQPHPKYKKRGAVPAFEMIRNSVNTHRGCFGGCAFCTISAHQGKQIVSRSEESILKEVDLITQQPDFHGTLTDLGGPSANMYRMKGKDPERCRKCARYSCIQPSHCPNLMSDHEGLIELYRKVGAHPKVKHLFIGSGIRYDLFTEQNNGFKYFKEVVLHHVSGRLKVAPEHTSAEVLRVMRKPPFEQFLRTKKDFDRICQEAGLKYQLIPYFISSHPGCRLQDMADLAVEMKRLGYRLEQVQDFTPTPMTLATEAYYTGLNPETLKPIYTAKSPQEKKAQNALFFYWKKEMQRPIRDILQKNHLQHYLSRLGLR